MQHIISPFHLAVPIVDMDATRRFYGTLLECAEGRSTDAWIDWNFFGHQLSTHLRPQETTEISAATVDGKQVPCRHFGVVLPWEPWHALKDRLYAHKEAYDLTFIIEPYIRFEGQVGEQATMFFLDPSGNALEFKSFKDPSQLFAV